jgi:hypothetical protein
MQTCKNALTRRRMRRRAPILSLLEKEASSLNSTLWLTSVTSVDSGAASAVAFT